MKDHDTVEVTYGNPNDGNPPVTAVFFSLETANECIQRVKALGLKILKLECKAAE